MATLVSASDLAQLRSELASFRKAAKEAAEACDAAFEATTAAQAAEKTAEANAIEASKAAEEAAAAAPPAKKQRVGRVTAAAWRALIAAGAFERVRVRVDDETFGLRPNQQDELRKWAAKEAFEADWLLVKGGMPSCFVSQGGDEMKLQVGSPRGNRAAHITDGLGLTSTLMHICPQLYH